MREHVWSRVGLLGWTVIVSLSAWSAAVAAETLPASVRACAALTDSLQRLVCYDREVARFPEPAAKTATKPDATPTASATKSAPTPPASTPSSAAASSSASSTSVPTNTDAAAGNDKAAAPPSTSAAPAKDSGRIAAHVVTIDHQPNEMVLHLDNGQVWQQLQSVSGDLSLREGDTVKIEKRLGVYWLSGPHVSSMRVKQIS